MAEALSRNDFLAAMETRFEGRRHSDYPMVRNIRNIFNRAQLTDQEVRTLRGIIVALAEKKWRGDR